MTLFTISRVVSEWCLYRPFVRRAWIFGSWSRGENHGDSDIDIALDVTGITRFESGYSAFRAESHRWKAELSSFFSAPVHVCHYNENPEIPLDEDTPDIKAEVDKDGLLIYDTSHCSTATRFVRLDVVDFPR